MPTDDRREPTSDQGRRGPVSTGIQRTGSQRTGSQRVQRTGTQPTGTQRTGSQRTGSQRIQPKPRWRRWLRPVIVWGLVSTLVVVTVGFVGLSIAYARIEIPAPSDFAQYQASTVYYSDGETVMARLGQANRESISLDTLPEFVPHAIVAAEDRTFYTNPGIDLMGTARAMFKTVVLGKRQGGSSITQQYVERYYVGATTTDIPGKIKEALLALKIDQQQSKEQVLENYMNTIYFGRGAYGIQAAAREYFGHDAAQLTVSEAAMLAGIIPAPSAWDPRIDPEQARYRWNYVLDGMVSEEWLTPAERFRLDFPEVKEYRNEDTYGGPKGYILKAAIDEVAQRAGITAEDVETGGFQIVTTIDKSTQNDAERAARSLPDGHSKRLRMAIVTIDPTTGGITAMYGGADYLTIQRNAVTQDIAQAGSTFKPFALIAALKQGYALESTYNGKSGKKVPGFSKRVRNFAGENFGDINLITATAHSVNTVYAQLTHDIGPQSVMDAAIAAGLPEDTAGLEANPANVLGTASPHPLDMAAAYATIAAGGVKREPFLVQAVLARDGSTVYEHKEKSKRVFSESVMAEVTYAMQQVVKNGTASYVSRLNRPIAGKTGTSNDNKSAWFIGFTPQVVGLVVLYQVGDDGSAEAIKPFGGFSQITGGSVPARIWTTMMKRVFKGMPVVNFPPRSHIGIAMNNVPSPEPEPSPSPSFTPSPEPSLPPPDPSASP